MVRIGRVGEGSWVSDDSIETFSDALVLCGFHCYLKGIIFWIKMRQYLDDGVDVESICIGEDKNSGVETGGFLEELDAALHGWVLENDRVSSGDQSIGDRW